MGHELVRFATVGANIDFVDGVLNHASDANFLVATLVTFAGFALKHLSFHLFFSDLLFSLFQFLLFVHFFVVVVQGNTPINNALNLSIDTLNFTKEVIRLLL